MYKKNDKRRLYWLIDSYLSKEVTAKFFCDEYYYCYDLELDDEFLTDLEKDNFSRLSAVVSRFSEFKEDIENYPGIYFTEQELKQKIIETKENLK